MATRTKKKPSDTTNARSIQAKSPKSKKISVPKDSALKIQRVKRPDGKDDVYMPIEREFKNFVGLVSIELDGKKIGALLCRKGEDSYRLWYPFRAEGIPAALTTLDAEAAWKRLDGGLKELPKGEALTFRLQSKSSDLSRQIALSNLQKEILHNPLAANLDTDFLSALVTAQKARIQQLKKEGLYQPKTFEIYASYTIDSDQEYADMVEKWVNYFLKYFLAFFRKKVTGSYARNVYNHLLQTITSSYLRGYKFWESLLNDKSGLAATPMDVQEVWESLWYRFNSTPAPSVPNYLILDESGLHEVVSTDLSLVSVLIESEGSIPVAARSYVNCNGSYQAIMIAKSKPGQIDSPCELLRYMWESIKDMPDVELITQVRAGNQELIELNLARQTAQAVGRQRYASGKGTVSARAIVDLDESVEAQKDIYKGAFVINAAPIAIIRRPTQIALRDACRDFSSKFLRPASWVREVDYCWTPWLQSLTGMRWDWLNVTPYDREIKFLSSEAPSFIPAVNVSIADTTGLEVLSHEGLSPLYIDLFGSEVRHAGFYGITRCGKSVLAAQAIVEALLRGIPVLIVDYPRPDGTGTFSEFVPFLKGAYYTLSGHSINIFEIPRLLFDSNKAREDRLNDLKDNILDFLLAMVKGDAEDKSALATILKAFFSDYSILSRYEQANTDGFGGAAWGNTPTLIDFIGFCTPGRLGLSTSSLDILRRLERFQVALQGWADSRIGAAISKPSTVPLDAPLFAIALNQLNNQEDSKILAMAINLVMKRRQLSVQRSLTIFDESPILFTFNEIAEQIGAMVANGAKYGSGVLILAQEANTISQTKAGIKVLSGLSIQMIGRLNNIGVKSFQEILDIPAQLINKCASRDFDRIPGRFYSSWLLLFGSKSGIYVRFYPSLFLLAAVANNQDETALRLLCMKESMGNKVEAMVSMAKQLVTKSQ
jgi:hypothetical protein